MANQIILKKSSVVSKVPATGDLAYGELALNYADGKLYYKRSDNIIDAFTVASNFAPASHTHDYLPLSGGTLTGAVTFAASQTWPTFNQNTTGSAATLTTGRTIGMTGDVTWTSGSFNGSANVTGTATLANSGVTAGSYGSSTTVPTYTVDAKGRLTAASNTSIAFPVTSVAGKTGAVTLTNADVGLGNVSNSLQVTNTSGVPSASAGLLSARPAAGTAGRLYIATDTYDLYRDTGTAWDLIGLGSTNGLVVRTGAGSSTSRSIAVSGTGLSVSNADGTAGNPTITCNATNANTASTVVARDASGNFSAGTVTTSAIVVDSTLIDYATTTTTATTQVALASFAAASYGCGEFLIQATQGTVRQVTKILVTHNGTAAIATEYGVLLTGSNLFSVDVDISGGNVRILITPTSATSTVFKSAYTLIGA